MEGEKAGEPTAGHLARDDVVTCGLGDRVGGVRDKLDSSMFPFALVVSSGGVLLGRLRGSMLNCDPNLTAEEVMEPGPSTVRADTLAGELAERLANGNLRWAILTTPEGRLLGVVSRDDLERA